MTTSSGNKHIKNYIKGRDINYDDDELNDSVMSSVKVEKSIDNTLSFDLFYSNLVEMFNKHKYRKVFYEIHQKESLYSNQNYIHNLVLSHLKMNCLFRIINKKFRKYSNSLSPKGLEEWLNISDILLSNLSTQVKTLPIKSRIDHYELLTLYHLKNLFNYAMFCKQTKKYTDFINYLCLCERMINSLSMKITYPETLNIIQQIFLLFSSQLITDEDFCSSKMYLIKVLHIGVKQLELEMGYNKEEGLNGIKSDDIFYNLSLCMYQLGVCFENDYDFDKADDSYSQANWLGLSFLYNKSRRFVRFIKEVSNRARNYYNITQIMKYTLHYLGNEVKEKKTLMKGGIYQGEAEKINRFNKLEKFLNSIKIREIDYDDQELFHEVGKKTNTPAVHKMTCNVELLNYLMTEDFKPVVTTMNNLDINYFSTETKSKIQKTINSIKTAQRMELSRRERKEEKKNDISSQSQSKTYTINNQLTLPTNTNSNSNYKSTSTIHNKTPQKKDKKAITSYSFYSRNIPSHQCNSQQNSNRPLKIKYDKYVFNNSYQTKLSYLNAQMEKEYKFQKDLLNTKKYEKIECDNFDSEKAKHEADYFFRKKLQDEIRLVREKEKNSKLNEKLNPHLSIYKQLKYIYEIKACKSLKMKSKDVYDAFLKNTMARASKTLKKEMGLSTTYNHDDDNPLANMNGVPTVNKSFINKLEYDIDNINKKEQKIQKIISGNEYKNNKKKCTSSIK